MNDALPIQSYKVPDECVRLVRDLFRDLASSPVSLGEHKLRLSELFGPDPVRDFWSVIERAGMPFGEGFLSYLKGCRSSLLVRQKDDEVFIFTLYASPDQHAFAKIMRTARDLANAQSFFALEYGYVTGESHTGV